MKNSETLSAAFISTYPPRKCGIGTFSSDLVRSLKKIYIRDSDKGDHFQVVALNNISHGYDFPPEVHFTIREQYRGDYREAAEFLNLSTLDVVNLQHEYGIFGGDDGSHIVYLLQHLKKPVITTLHTVLDNPSPGQKETLKAITSLSTRIVVLAEKAIELLRTVYGVSEKKIVMIPHGAPDVPFLDASYYKDHFQAEERRVLLTFGLLSENKGIEYVLEALPAVVRTFPDVLYLVLGATHPNVKREQGERYRISLESRVKELGLQQHVVFHNQYVTLERLVEFLVATDIYITPYLSKEQISSGTLAYALACGKAIISTPYWYAEELLQSGRGMLVPFKNSELMAEKICTLLSNDVMRNRIRKNAYQFGRKMVWNEVARQYDTVFEQAATDYGRNWTGKQSKSKPLSGTVLPEIKLGHMSQLTDDTGILQHAIFRTPSRAEGYTTDDNARALMVAVMNHELFHDDSILPWVHTYLAFLNHAFDPLSGRMHNYMSYNREWLDTVGSEDSHGRAIWSLGYTIWQAPNHSVLSLANHVFREALKVCPDFSSPRSWAYCILGCNFYLDRFGGDTEVKHIIERLAEKLSSLYTRNHAQEWQWFENIVTYANARLPQGLLVAGQYLHDETMVHQGLESLGWLIKIQTVAKSKSLSLIGNSAWFKKNGRKSHFDQQPVEAYAIMDACLHAFEITGDETWRHEIDKAFAWFLGKNDKHDPLYDFKTGGCYDGLHRGGVNQNQGAESVLTWLASLHLMYKLLHKSIDPDQS